MAIFIYLTLLPIAVVGLYLLIADFNKKDEDD